MNYRKFGCTELLVSEVGFGCWAIGGDAVVGKVPIGWGPADDNTSVEAIHKALDAGINFFDTADFYGLGHSEELLGKVLYGVKDIVIATKVGHRAINDSISLDYSGKYIMEACEKSLKRLKRDQLDIYQLHSARISHFDQDDCAATMELLKSQGKIRYWGLSLNTFIPWPEAEYMMAKKSGDCFQLVHNLINQGGTDIIKKAGGKGYGIIARMPLQFGLLTGKFSTDNVFGKNDHRQFRLTPGIIRRSVEILETKLWPLCSKYNISKTSLAMSYILSNDRVSTVIPGLRTALQVDENTSGIVPLEKEDMEMLEGLYKTDWPEIIELMKVQN